MSTPATWSVNVRSVNFRALVITTTCQMVFAYQIWSAYNFISSKDIERYQKIRKWVTEMTFKRHSRSSGMTQFDRAPTIS